MTVIWLAIYFLGVILSFGQMANDYMNMDLDKHFSGLAAMAVIALLWPAFLLVATGYYLLEIRKLKRWQ